MLLAIRFICRFPITFGRKKSSYFQDWAYPRVYISFQDTEQHSCVEADKFPTGFAHYSHLPLVTISRVSFPIPKAWTTAQGKKQFSFLCLRFSVIQNQTLQFPSPVSPELWIAIRTFQKESSSENESECVKYQQDHSPRIPGQKHPPSESPCKHWGSLCRYLVPFWEDNIVLDIDGPSL